MNIIVSHPTSNQNNRAAINGMLNANILSEFHTSIASFPGDFLDYLSRIDKFKDFSRRRFDNELKQFTHSHSVGELRRLLAAKLNFDSLIKHETGVFSVDAIYKKLDIKVSSRLKNGTHIDAIYTYEDCALHSFQTAKKRGVKCLYDLPIGYWRSARNLLSEEIEKWPDWASTLTGFQDSEIKLQRKDQELALADHIFVASSFTAKTLEDYSGTLAQIDVIPYGFPKPIENRIYSNKKRPLKVLFVGGLSQRKGIAYMFEVVKQLAPHVELTVVGGKFVDDCKPLNAALEENNWIPSLPHHDVLKLMREHDVLLFPSLFEGFGLVITEAMSQGTPVITTNRTAGPDLINHGKNGWLIDAGSTESLKGCLEELIKHPDAVVQAGKEAIKTAKKRPWHVYGQELANVIKSI